MSKWHRKQNIWKYKWVWVTNGCTRFRNTFAAVLSGMTNRKVSCNCLKSITVQVLNSEGLKDPLQLPQPHKSPRACGSAITAALPALSPRQMLSNEANLKSLHWIFLLLCLSTTYIWWIAIKITKPAFLYSKLFRQNTSLILEISDTLTWFEVAMKWCTVLQQLVMALYDTKSNSSPLASREGGEIFFVRN